jgi:hypothetical protein
MALKNLTTCIDNTDGKITLIIGIDVSADTIANASLSSSGKSKLVASTGSIRGIPIDLPGGLTLDLNVTASIKNAKSEQQAAE